MIPALENNPAALASKFINHTNRHVFLTGKAGTGKTTFLKHIIQYTHKRAVIVAPTGIAAINAGGVTIHSLFQLPFGAFVPVKQSEITNQNTKINTPFSIIQNLQMNDSKRKIIRELELLIIDEVSMLRADLLDAIDIVIKHVRRNSKPFGGVQVLFIGDMLQLPPVIKDDEWSVLKSHYKSIYFFDAQVLKEQKPLYIELEKIYRQADNVFINLLNNLRNNKITSDDVAFLNKHYKPNFKSNKSDNYITLTTHNNKANELNKECLQDIKSKSYFFQAKIDGEFSEYAYPVEQNLELKLGSQIMFIKNDASGQQRFFNGKIGVISTLTDDTIEVKFEDSTTPVVVESYEWQNVRYVLNEVTNEIEEKTIGTFTQYPIKLAWAITVHKSQGLTFEKAIIDIGGAFAPGQVYVALSRLKSLDGLILKSPISDKIISQDETIIEFGKSKESQENLDVVIKNESDLFLKMYLLQSFDFTATLNKLNYHIDTYTKEENKSAKQKHHAWAIELREEFSAVKTNADKFLNQLNSIFENRNENHLTLLNQRTVAAKDYFEPLLKDLIKKILKHLEIVKTEKKVKTYIEELLEIDASFYKLINQLHKATVLTDSMLHNKEFTKADVRKTANTQERIAQITEALVNVKPPRRERKSKREKKKVSTNEVAEKKIDTKTASYNLYKQGKSIADIAHERNLAEGTIAGHLAHYVEIGKLDVKEFVSLEKAEEIITVAKTLEKISSGAIKALLGDEYTYSDIRFALAYYNKT